LFAGSNCFSGTLPSNICDATNLVKLDLSSLSSGSDCRKYIWAGLGLESVFTGFVAASSMQGSLPSCLLALPRLKALNANGNQLPCDLPMSISSSLNTILLSRNKIYGTISELLAFSANLTTLDLSYNRISGGLDAFASSSDEQLFTQKGMQLHLQGNHLSGSIPNSLREVNTINILSGNVLACSANANELPIHDPGRNSYQCGSKDMNTQMYAFGALLLIAVIIVLRMKHLTGMQRCFAKFDLWLRVATGRKVLGYDFASAHMMRYTRNLQSQRVFAFMIGVATIVALICYVSLSGTSERTVDISYAWVATAAYLTGLKSTMVMLSCGILYISYIWFLIYLDDGIVTTDHYLDSAIIVNNGNGKSAFLTRLQNVMLPALRLWLLIILVWGVIVGGNYWYIRIQLNGTIRDQQIFQFCFAAFKLFWSMFATPYLFGSETLHFGVDVKHHEGLILWMFGGNYQLFFVMNIFTSFLIPMLTIAVVDDTCFHNAFFQADPAITSSLVDTSFQIGGTKGNIKYDIRSTSVAPFTYGYSCSDSMIRIYTPLYMQMSTLLVLKSILSLIYLCWDTYESEKALEDTEPGILHKFMNLLGKVTAPILLVLKSVTSLINTCLCRGTSESEKAIEYKEPEKQQVFMNFLRMLTPTKQLLYGNNRRHAAYKSGRVFESKVKLWITEPLPGNLANMVILLTFGFAAPALAMMSVTNIVMDSYVCQLVLGRFIESEVSVLLEHKRQSEDVVDAPMKSEGHFISMRRRARMQDALKDVDEPWGASAALKEVEAQCEHVPASALMQGRTVFVLITSALFAMLLIDVDNSSSSQQSTSAGAAIAIISFAFTLVLLTWIYYKYTVCVNRKISTGEPSGNSDQMELGIEMRETQGASEDQLKNSSTKNPIIGSTIIEDEIPGATPEQHFGLWALSVPDGSE